MKTENNLSKSITCKWCGGEAHHIGAHFKQQKCTAVPEKAKNLELGELIELYKEEFPDAPTISAGAAELLRRKRENAKPDVAAETYTVGYTTFDDYKTELVAAHELFELPLSELSTATGQPLKISVNINSPFPEYVPQAKKGYVFGDMEVLKDVLMMLELGIPGYLWGHAGTGKTSLPTQVCALTNRPVIRAQHTASTEEAHITGQMLAKGGSTYFEPGLLALAMRYGWVYLADEYDFAYPQILGIYQPVLEGEPLIIKEATPEWRGVKPHKRFAFIGTGNTNGSGDETGLYQGTNIQNAANFSRFGIVSNVQYLPRKYEEAMMLAAGLNDEYAKNMVRFAWMIRDAFESHTISQPIGPRELLNSASIGMARGNFITGLKKAFINKLPSTSAKAAEEAAQRVFGG